MAARRKLTDAQVARIREARIGGELLTSIAARFGVSQTTVCHICLNQARPGVFSKQIKVDRRSKVTYSDIAAMRALREVGATFRELAEQYGLSKEYARRLCHGTARKRDEHLSQVPARDRPAHRSWGA